MKIGICDDEQLVAEKLERIITDCMQEIGQEVQTFLFLSGKQLIEGAEELDAVFLDVKMDGMDGYETGKQIKRINPDCSIVMATGNQEDFYKAFEIEAIRYICKPFEKEKIREALEKIVRKLEDCTTLRLHKDGIAKDVRMKDIKYIQSYNGYTLYYAEKIVYRDEISLRNVEVKLSDAFIKISKQYIVNMEYIEVEPSKDKVYIDGLELTVSRRQKQKFKQAYLNYEQ